MRKRAPWTLLLLLFLFAGEVKAQAELPPAEDSLFVTEGITEQKDVDETGSYFNRIDGVPAADVRLVPDSVVRRIRSEKDYWYLQEKPVQEEAPRPKPETGSGWGNTIFWIIAIAAFVGILLWFLSTGNIRLFRRQPRKLASHATDEQASEGEDIFTMNFQRELQSARSAGNFRLVIRLHYLQTLRELSQRGLITYTPEKTNGFYVSQLSGTPYYREFFQLTRHFDYAWYGNFAISEQGLGRIEEDFSTFKQRMS